MYMEIPDFNYVRKFYKIVPEKPQVCLWDERLPGKQEFLRDDSPLIVACYQQK
jgi:hypothetical protein